MNIFNLIAWIIGIIAFLVFISSIQLKNKKKFLILQLIANFLYGIQYVLLITPEAAYMNFISVIRCFIFYLYEDEKKKPPVLILIILLSLITLVGCFTINRWIALIPVAITIIYTISSWQKNMKIIRLCFTIAACFWIIYNLSVGAYTSLIGNAFELISGIVSMIRFKNKRD